MMQTSFRYTAPSVICTIVFSLFSACLQAAQLQTEKSYDVIVAGAGTGGTAAAIQAARLGSKVALLEESDWIGGQMAAAGVSTMDEGLGPQSTPPSGFYAEFLARVRAFYLAHGKSIDTCYWNPRSHCFAPSAAQQILKEMIAGVNDGKDNPHHGRVDLYLQDRVVQVLSDGDTVTGVVTSKHQRLSSKILIDATEYGDVLPLTPARYRSGHSIGPDEQNACTQAITWTAVIKKYPQGVPSELEMKTPPPGYDSWLPGFERTMRPDGNPVNRNLPVSFPIYTVYRGLPDLSNPQDYTALDPKEITRTSMDWFNDYDVTTAIFDRSKRQAINCQAKLKTIANLYYIQHVIGEKLWSVANDEGYDTAYNRSNSCPEIPEEYKAIERNMPQIPYVRESNRLVGIYTLTAGDIRREGNWAKSVIGFTDAIAVGNYADDLHGCNREPGFYESDLEHITDLPPGFRFGAFQVPLRSLIPERVDGLLAAEKNISQSRLANGATRLQPITMLTGQAAGALAGLAVAEKIQPRAVPPEKVQLVLLRTGDILARENMPEMQAGGKAWQAAQLAVVHQWITITDGEGYAPSKQLTRTEGARILVAAFLGSQSVKVANTGGFDPPPQILQQAYSDVPLYDPLFNTVAALHAAGAAPVCGVAPTEFCPTYGMSMGEFLHSVALLSAREPGTHAVDDSALRSGISASDGEPLTRENAAIILYNATKARLGIE